MSAVAAAIEAMRAKGIADSDILDIVAHMAAAETASTTSTRTARQERNARYYASQKRLKASYSDDQDGVDVPPKKETSPTPPKEKTTPLPSDPTGLRCLSARRHEWPADFAERVWSIYPRKTEKQPGMVALADLHRKDRLDWQTLIGGIEDLIANVEPQFAPALHRWLKKARWTDQHAPPARAGPAKGPTKYERLDDAFGDIFHGPVQSQPRLRIASGG